MAKEATTQELRDKMPHMFPTTSAPAGYNASEAPCGTCWDMEEHNRGYCQTKEAKKEEEIRNRPIVTGASLSSRMFLLALSYQKAVHTDEGRETVRKIALAENSTQKAVSDYIDILKGFGYRKDVFVGRCPSEITTLEEADGWFRNRIAQATAEVKAAAVEVEDLGIHTGYYSVNEKRYHISAPTDGNWKGYLFFSTGSDYHSRQRLGMKKPGQPYTGKAAEAFAQILEDPTEAMKAYGRITGSCGKCGRKLEDESSRAAGIGPICAQAL